MNVGFSIVLYKNGRYALERLEKHLLPSMEFYKNKNWKIQIYCIDNNLKPDFAVLDFISKTGFKFTYEWNGGINEKIASAKTRLFAIATCEFMIYVCANHGVMYDPTWVEDLLEPFKDSKVALTGKLDLIDFVALKMGKGEMYFVNGGIMGARVSILKKFPYSLDWPHNYSDHWIGWKLQSAGYKVANVPSIEFVWKNKCPHQGKKWVHSEGRTD